MRFLFGGCATAMEFFMNTLTETVDLQAPPPPLAFTDAAVAKVKDLLAEENSPGLNLRVFVQGGGCSGFQYGFTFDETVNDDDTTVDKDGVKLLIDPMSFQYLVGAEIAYKDDLEGAQFVIRNHNAVSTAGCNRRNAVRGTRVSV